MKTRFERNMFYEFDSNRDFPFWTVDNQQSVMVPGRLPFLVLEATFNSVLRQHRLTVLTGTNILTTRFDETSVMDRLLRKCPENDRPKAR